jgi:hypothetical protein
MVLPDYKNSIVNVSSSIIAALGGRPSGEPRKASRALYAPLAELDFLRGQKKIVLLVIDGLGYEFLKKKGQGSFLWKNCSRKVTSVFPSTTASAETSLATGAAPQQHAITGWLMFLKELGVVAKILLFEARAGGSLNAMGVSRKDIFCEKFIADKIPGSSMMVLPKVVAANYPGSRTVTSFDDMPEMVKGIERAAKSGKRFIYAYWIGFDKVCHKTGSLSLEAVKHFHEIDRIAEELSVRLKRQGACLVITADHGFTDVPKKNRIVLQDYPDIYDCLTLPLCGESRAPFCYVRPGADKQFRLLVKKQLGFCCELRKGPDLIKNGMFGLGPPNPRLYERVGDYIMLVKNGYTIRDLIFGESKPDMIGYHGGLSKEEMYVPLIVSR